MEYLRLSDLQDKDVVDLKSGIKVGNIIDIKALQPLNIYFIE